MPWKYRLTRLGWARAILEGDNTYAFSGIQRIGPKDLRHYQKKQKANCLTASMLSDSSFTDQLHYDEVKHLVGDPDWHKDVWKEHVKRIAHTYVGCPNGSPEERKAYGANFRSILKNATRKWDFAAEYVRWDDIEASIENMTQDLESIAWTLKKHPIKEVYQVSQERWIDIGDVTVFCPECSEPMDGCDRNAPEKIEPHKFDATCDLCEGRSEMSCFFNNFKEPRAHFYCPSCSFSDALDLLEGGFVEKYQRPADWPPGAPYPPHRDFVGGPLDAYPDED